MDEDENISSMLIRNAIIMSNDTVSVNININIGNSFLYLLASDCAVVGLQLESCSVGKCFLELCY